MKKLLLLLLLFPLLSFGQSDDTTKYIHYRYTYGNRMDRYWANKVLRPPTDTTNSKFGLAIKSGQLYWGNENWWTAAGSGTGDMILASAQTNTGVKTFLNGTMGLRNVANTFTSFFSNTNTASRTYTLKDGNGTIPFVTDLYFENTSDATSHTLTNAEGSTNIKFVEGTGITLTTTGTLGQGILTIATTAGVGDMILASAQTNSGVKTFLDGTMGLRNVANTFTSFFTNTNSAARTYTLQNANGTLAFLTDIPSTPGIDAVLNVGQALTSSRQVDASGGWGVTFKTLVNTPFINLITGALTNTNGVGTTQQHETSGTAADGFGLTNTTSLEGSDGTMYTAATFSTIWTTAAAVTRTSKYELSLLNGGVESRKLVIEGDGRIYGFGLHNSSGAVTGTTNQYIASGTYTPGLTNVTNVAASTAYLCQWIRVGNVVTVSGKVDIDATAAGATELGIALPIASALALEQHLGGAANSSAAAGLSAAIRADATNDRAAVVFTATSVTNDSYFFTFTYTIL